MNKTKYKQIPNKIISKFQLTHITVLTSPGMGKVETI